MVLDAVGCALTALTSWPFQLETPRFQRIRSCMLVASLSNRWRRPRVKSKFLICGSTSTTCTIINLSQSTFTFSRTFYIFSGRRRWSIFTMLYVVCRVDRRYVLVGIKTEDTINFTVHRSQRSGYWEGTNSTRWLQLLTFLLLLPVLKVKFCIRSTVDVLWFRLLILWVSIYFDRCSYLHISLGLKTFTLCHGLSPLCPSDSY